MRRYERYYRHWMRELVRFLTVCVICFAISAAMIFMILAVAGCERRDLYIYGDEFHSLTLEVDWHEYASRNPDGMTTWFWPKESAVDVPDSLALWGEPYRFTTASVRSFDLYLRGGQYFGVVVDYSPEEYSKQEFLDMDNMMLARVVATPDANQPVADTAGLARELYGPQAYGPTMPGRQAGTDFYEVMNQPEEMGVDTLQEMVISAGEYGDYIPLEERERYQQTLTVKRFEAQPRSAIWTLRLRLPVKGIAYVWQIEGTLAGMANGHYLARNMNTDTPCLIRVDNWQMMRPDSTGMGYVEATVRTFGLRPGAGTSEARGMRRGGELVIEDASEVRLNLQFTLRDRATVLSYHFDLGRYVEAFDDEQVLQLFVDAQDFELDDDLGGEGIDLPYVEPYNGTGFGADVTPWADGGDANVDF